MKNQIGYTIFFASVVVACWATHSSLDQDVAAQDRVAKTVTDLAEPMVKSKEVAGLSIGIVSLGESGELKSETLHFGSAGGSEKSAEAQPPADNTLYEMGGIANAFTGILLANAVQRGELKLDTPAAELMPDGVKMPGRGGREISLLNLITQRSGLPRLAGNMPRSNVNDPYHDYTPQLAGEFLNQHKLKWTPGTHYEYSNFGTSYLGYLLTRKSDVDSYNEMLTERMAGPLKMTSTKVLIAEDDAKLAAGHSAAGAQVKPWHCTHMPGAGGIRTSIADMNRFMMANIKSPDDEVGKSIDLAFQKHVDPIGREFAMGLGWSIARDRQTRFRNGRTNGFASAIFINRELNLGICVLSNTASDKIFGLAEQLIRMKAGIKVMAPSSEEHMVVKTDVMDRCVGRYQLAPQFIFDVRRIGEKLTVGITNQPTTRVYPRSDVEWFYKEVKASLLFGDFKDGKANSLTLIQNGLRQKASRIGDRDGAGYPKLSPFSAIRWRSETPEVQVEGKWYELVSLNDISVGDILSFSHRTFGKRGKKRFEEDLVEVLTRMGHTPKTTVDLVVKGLETKTIKGVAMTKKNRDAIYAAAMARDK